jgi:hypothetical protein
MTCHIAWEARDGPFSCAHVVAQDNSHISSAAGKLSAQAEQLATWVLRSPSLLDRLDRVGVGPRNM